MPFSQYSVSIASQVTPYGEEWLEFYNINTPNGANMQFRWQYHGSEFRTSTSNLDETLTSHFDAQFAPQHFGAGSPDDLWLFYYSAINAGNGNDTLIGLDTGVKNDILARFAQLGAPASDLTGVELYATAADLLIGGNGNDTINGRGGNDTLEGDAGDDTIDGGADIDTAIYSGSLSSYQITILSQTSFKIKDLRTGSPDGTDTVSNVEFFSFAGTTVNASDLLPVDHWIGGTGLWSDASKWDRGVPHDPNTAVFIDTAGANVTLDQDVTIYTLDLGADASLRTANKTLVVTGTPLVEAPLPILKTSVSAPSITGMGKVVIETGGTFDVGSLSSPFSVEFAGKSGTLKLQDPYSFTGPITGFTGDNKIELPNTPFSPNSYSVLQTADSSNNPFDGRGGPGCLNRISASLSGACAEVRPPRGTAAGRSRLDRA